jgi:hypothetical protein
MQQDEPRDVLMHHEVRCSQVGQNYLPARWEFPPVPDK